MFAKKSLILSLGLLFVSSFAFAQEQWRQYGLAASERLVNAIEILDETLHEVYEAHETAEFAAAIEDIHHIEDLINTMIDMFPSSPYRSVCMEFDHLYEDLVQIRLDLIALGLERNPQVVQNWNNMVYIYNNELNPVFSNCAYAPQGGRYRQMNIAQPGLEAL